MASWAGGPSHPSVYLRQLQPSHSRRAHTARTWNNPETPGSSDRVGGGAVILLDTMGYFLHRANPLRLGDVAGLCNI